MNGTTGASYPDTNVRLSATTTCTDTDAPWPGCVYDCPNPASTSHAPIACEIDGGAQTKFAFVNLRAHAQQAQTKHEHTHREDVDPACEVIHTGGRAVVCRSNLIDEKRNEREERRLAVALLCSATVTATEKLKPSTRLHFTSGRDRNRWMI